MALPQITAYRLQILISRLLGATKDGPNNGDVLRWNAYRGCFEPQAFSSGGGAGPQGPPGPQGPAGAKGDQGQPGDAGEAGPPGARGAQGEPGEAGAAGAAGVAGPAGAAGAQGVQGPQGSPGLDGMNGAEGAAGAQGPAGVAGAAGATGATGPAGVKGDQGDAGPQGLPGAAGAAGTQGTAGAVGATGAPGQAGADGATGAQGPQGPTGAAGSTGATGSTGSTGSTGATGPAGPSVWGGISGTLSSQSDLSSALAGKAASVHSHAQSDVTGLAASLALLAPLASPAFSGTPTGITKAHVGLGNADNTSDANKPISSAVATVLSALLGLYRLVFQAAGSHIAARAAGTYALGLGDPAAVTGVGTLYPLAVLRIDSADFPTINALAAKLRVKWSLSTNDVAPFSAGQSITFGLYPITRPATSGGAGLAIFALGTVVPGSTSGVTAPAADAQLTGQSGDFALPADGAYVLGFVTTAAVATSAHLHTSAALFARNA